MTQLRAYYYNGKDMMELVRYQKKEQPQAVEAEKDIILSPPKMLRAEKTEMENQENVQTY